MDRAPQEKKRLQLIKIPVNISFFFAFFFFPNVKMTDSYSTCCSHSRNSPVLLVPQLVQPLHFELFTSTEINTSQPAPLATMIWECRRKCGPNCLLDEPILAARGRSLQGNTSPPPKKKNNTALPPPGSWPSSVLEHPSSYWSPAHPLGKGAKPGTGLEGKPKQCKKEQDTLKHGSRDRT